MINVLTLTNVTGFGTSLEDAKSVGIAAAKLTYAFSNAVVPKINLITGNFLFLSKRVWLLS